MTTMRVALRLAALVLGLIATFDGVVVNVLVSVYRHINQVLGGSGDPSHGIIGFGLCLAFLVGAVLALRFPLAAGIILVLAGIGFFFVVHAWALLVSPQVLIAAWLAFADSRESSGQSRGLDVPRGRRSPAATA
jgi:hypothetical protein